MTGGMGGMGGGLMGTLMRSAMGGRNSGQPEALQPATDEYDVDRWKRADDLDNTTLVQAVRRDWEQKQPAKQRLGQKLRSLLGRKQKASQPESSEAREPLPAGGTITTPEMKKASQRIHAAPAQETAVPEQHRYPARENYLGLHFRTELGGFFTENPVNSAILAVDRLGLGPLTLNQVTSPKPPQGPCSDPSAPPEKGKPTPGDGAETSYMNTLRQSREQRKYEVRIND